MSVLILMSGIPGSGKTYHTKELQEKYGAKAISVSTDDIREEMGYNLNGENWDNVKEKEMWRILIKRIVAYSSQYDYVIADCTAITNKRRKWFYEQFHNYYDKFELHIIQATVSKAIAQDAMRTRHVPHRAIARMSYLFEEPDDYITSKFKISKY